MAQATARIRRCAVEDEKLVLFMAGKANMELLAEANFKTYFNPFILGAWIGLSSLAVGLLGAWPNIEKNGMLGYLTPIPAFAALAVPIMFAIDWANRSPFEARTQKVLRSRDIHDVANHYSRAPATGFWILEYGKTFVGLISVDLNEEPKSKKSSKQPPTRTGNSNSADATSDEDGAAPPKTAIIRHFYVAESFRKTNIQDDLLKHAVGYAFEHDPELGRITASECTLLPYIGQCLSRAGFKREGLAETIGILRWKIYSTSLLRTNWS